MNTIQPTLRGERQTDGQTEKEKGDQKNNEPTQPEYIPVLPDTEGGPIQPDRSAVRGLGRWKKQNREKQAYNVRVSCTWPHDLMMSNSQQFKSNYKTKKNKHQKKIHSSIIMNSTSDLPYQAILRVLHSPTEERTSCEGSASSI